MAFFVVARTSDGHLQLVSPDTFSSRQAAMSSLSEATREPGFAHWDAELLVADLDSAVPVLLVRPTQPETPAPETDASLDAAAVEGVELAEDVVVAAEASALIEELESEDVVELVGDGIVGEEPEVVEALEVVAELEVAEALEVGEELEVAEEAGAVENMQPAAPVEAVEEPPVAEEPIPSEEPETAVAESIEEVRLEPYAIEDVAIGEAIAEEILAELESDTGQVEATESPFETLEPSEESAIFEPPISAEEAPAGAEEPPSFSVSALMVESAIADAVLDSEAPADAAGVDEIFGDLALPEMTGEPEPAVSIDERLGLAESQGAVEAPDTIGVPADFGSWQPDTPDAAADVSDSSSADSPAAAISDGTAEEVGGVVIAWPWDTQGDDETTGVTEEFVGDIELVEPSSEPIDDAIDEDRALDSVLVEPETLVPEASPEVPVGSAEPSDADSSDAAPTTEPDVSVSGAATDEATAEPRAETAPTVEAVGTSRDEIAEYIFDLENVTSIPEAEAKEPGTAESDHAGPTCGECVYDETCPNRDQRSPQECGSFQWKIA